MTTPPNHNTADQSGAMRPTSSADSADKLGADEYALTEYSADQWWFKELEGIVGRDRLNEDQYRGLNIARQLIPRLLAALASQTTAPQVVQAPIAYVNSDDLDNMLDDRTAEIQSNKSGWRGTPLFAAPIVATVPSDDCVTIAKLQKALSFWLPRIPSWENDVTHRIEQDAWLLCGLEPEYVVPCAQDIGIITLIDPVAGPIVATGDLSTTVPSEAIVKAWYATGQDIRGGSLQSFMDALNSAPSPTEQASDVLPKIAKLLEEADEQQRWGGGTDSDGALHNGTVDFEKLRREIAALLSAPAAKGNAPAEVKS